MFSFHDARMRRRLATLLREGVGVHEHSWPTPEGSAEGLLVWVRDVMASMRRPNGIDQVALALACRDVQGTVRRSSTLGVVPPGAFYGGPAEEGLRAFVRELEALPPADHVKVSAALVCLGDLAYALGRG